MKRYDTAVVGEIYLDHLFTGFAAWPQPGEEVFTDQYARELGGGAAITACALGSLGRSVSLNGSVGAEDLPWLESRLSSFGVSAEHLHPGKGKTGVTVSVSTTEDRSYFTYPGENVNLEQHLTTTAAIQNLTAATHVHFAMPLTPAAAERLLPILHSAGCTVSLDVGHHAAWLHDSINRATCASVDYLLPNEREAQLLCGTNADRYLDFTESSRWPNGVVKLGRRGAAMRNGRHRWQVASPEVQVVDTTGAGDAFDAGFIDGLLDGADGEECLRRGCICGGMSTRVAGALRGLPSRQELKECYDQSYR
jgi:sugar/nucleoside kinase (ribokinase family)